MPLTTAISVDIDSNYSKVLDLGSVLANFDINKRITMQTGTGAGKADQIFTDNRTLAASGTEDLDLAGVLVDAFGAALTMVKLKGVMIYAAAGNTNNVRVTRGANGVPLFLAASDGLDVVPGGLFLFLAPNAAAVTVTPATGDLLTITNSGSGTPVSYDVVLIGASA